mgnify:CR=1 FL=1
MERAVNITMAIFLSGCVLSLPLGKTILIMDVSLQTAHKTNASQCGAFGAGPMYNVHRQCISGP